MLQVLRGGSRRWSATCSRPRIILAHRQVARAWVCARLSRACPQADEATPAKVILGLEHVADQRRLPPNPPDVILVAIDYGMRSPR